MLSGMQMNRLNYDWRSDFFMFGFSFSLISDVCWANLLFPAGEMEICFANGLQTRFQPKRFIEIILIRFE